MTCAIVSIIFPCPPSGSCCESSQHHKHTNCKEGFTYLVPGLPATLSPSLSKIGNIGANPPATHSHWLITTNPSCSLARPSWHACSSQLPTPASCTGTGAGAGQDRPLSKARTVGMDGWMDEWAGSCTSTNPSGTHLQLRASQPGMD